MFQKCFEIELHTMVYDLSDGKNCQREGLSGRTLEVCNTNSQNLYAEMLLKLLGYKFKGKGTRPNGVAVIEEYLLKNGIKDLVLNDGCGMSRKNVCSSKSVVQWLAFLHSHKLGKDFMSSLAVAGESGTLRKKFHEVKGKFIGKSGFLNGVHAKSGDTLVISLLINSNSGSAVEFQTKVLTEFSKE